MSRRFRLTWEGDPAHPAVAPSLRRCPHRRRSGTVEMNILRQRLDPGRGAILTSSAVVFIVLAVSPWFETKGDPASLFSAWGGLFRDVAQTTKWTWIDFRDLSIAAAILGLAAAIYISIAVFFGWIVACILEAFRVCIRGRQ